MGFGARLRQKRQEKGLTQEQLGKGLGTDGADVGKAVVYGWEKEQHFPRVDQLELMCRLHGWSADQLLLDRATANDLLPAVAEIASSINGLPPAQRDWVVDVVRSTIEAAKATIRVNPNGVTHKDEQQEMSHDKASSNRRRAA